ncbi:hypothetical protein [Aeromicrobium sp.]|uniref:hypothetical protein n=1 Tax=Aeromicrobium sp. TaxID=1871063 RepID=UPI0019AC040D|nr:hypothetical protein [Aeromicrobium sp.]MBC7631439.1 hypothetical protein [Aeromicrobium sp.]
MSGRLGGIEERLTCPHVSDVVHAQMWVLEQVADLAIDLKRPVIVKEIEIKPCHSHPVIVLQLTTDDYGSCLLVVPCDASALRQQIRQFLAGHGSCLWRDSSGLCMHTGVAPFRANNLLTAVRI